MHKLKVRIVTSVKRSQKRYLEPVVSDTTYQFSNSQMCSPMIANDATRKSQSKASSGAKANLAKEPMDQSAACQRQAMTPMTPIDSCIRGLPVSNAKNIRSRFLFRLGIEAKDPNSNIRQPLPTCRPKPAIVKEPLKLARIDSVTDDSAHCSMSVSSSPTSTALSLSMSRPSKSRTVSFDNSVSVVPIPMRHEYSDRMKHQMWVDRMELHVNASRNAVEFAAEHWDWRQVAEDNDMVRTQKGERIHPVHFTRQCNMQRQFMLVMAAQQQQAQNAQYQ